MIISSKKNSFTLSVCSVSSLMSKLFKNAIQSSDKHPHTIISIIGKFLDIFTAKVCI